MHRRPLLQAALAGLALSTHNAARAQTAVSGRPVRIVVPFAPGGPGDNTLRLFAPSLRKTTGQWGVGDNKHGANRNLVADVSQPQANERVREWL